MKSKPEYTCVEALSPCVEALSSHVNTAATGRCCPNAVRYNLHASDLASSGSLTELSLNTQKSQLSQGLGRGGGSAKTL